MEKESKLYISASIADSLPSMVKNELAKLSAQKQEEFVEEYKRKSRSVGKTYLFFFMGVHYVYLENWGRQIGYWLTAAGLGLWFLIDLFRLPELVKNYNKDVAMDTMRNLKTMSN